MFCDEAIICDTSITGKNRFVYLYPDLEKWSKSVSSKYVRSAGYHLFTYDFQKVIYNTEL